MPFLDDNHMKNIIPYSVKSYCKSIPKRRFCESIPRKKEIDQLKVGQVVNITVLWKDNYTIASSPKVKIIDIQKNGKFRGVFLQSPILGKKPIGNSIRFGSQHIIHM